ncbi:MAG: hypothetical protein DMG00_27300 [Acidobacteria bacterium]|nr:MAG: hypothetical protein DMG00_27300 [Acidobacteriota bacterium]
MCNESEAVGRVMTNRNNNPGLQDVLADLAAAQTAVRRSSTAFDGAVAGLRETLNAIASANHAQGEAIDAVIAATEKALRLFPTADQH